MAWALLRWWTSDPDPWAAAVAGILGGNSGVWYPRSLLGGTTLFSKDDRYILQLDGVGGSSQPFENGQSGTGSHHGVGGKIPAIPTPSAPLSPGGQKRFETIMGGLDIGADIRWKVKSVD